MCVKKIACGSYALLKLRTFAPISTLKTVYYALVHPHHSYGLACWSNATKTSFKKIIILQNKIVRLMTYSDQRTPASGLYKSLQILALDNMIKLTLITIADSFHHKTLPKIFDNLFEYLKTSHSYNTGIRSNQNFFKPSVNTNIGKKSIQHRGVEVWQSLKLNIKLLGSTSFRTQVKKYLLDIDWYWLTNLILMVLIYATCLVNVLCIGHSVSIWSLLLLPFSWSISLASINIFISCHS